MYISLFVAIISALNWQIYCGTVPAAQYNSLQALYVATFGQNWTWQGGNAGIWNFTDTANPCLDNWDGVGCGPCSSSDENPCDVIVLNLAHYNLVGTLPSGISGLTALSNLNLFANSISGPIPTTISEYMPIIASS